MAQRFNPPPGWQVPPGFVPTSDWQPDPSWPQAPDGWSYWVDDAPQQAAAPSYGTPAAEGSYGSASTPSYGSASGSQPGAPSYGSASAPSYGSASSQQDGQPYGAASSPAAGGVPYGTSPETGGVPYGSPNGAYGSTAPGSASAAMAQAQAAGARKSIFLGIGFLVGGIVFTVVVLNFGYWSTWMFLLPIFGIITLIRGLIDQGKARKAMAAANPQGMGSPYPGTTPPGQNPPGTF